MFVDNAQKALDEAEPADEEYIELRDALAKAQAAYDNINGQLQGYQAQLDEGKKQMYAQGLISSPNLDNDQLVVEAKAALRRLKVQLLEGQLQLTTGTATAYSQFEAARAQLDAGWQEYQAGVQQLADSRAEYETQKADAQQKLDEGLQQLTDAEEQVSKIKKGEWYVLDRNSTLSFVTFEQYADRMDAIARVFPVFFFLVAALVATTTMTRMVDENRLQMGETMTDWRNEHGTDQEISAGQRVCTGTAGLSGGGSGGGGIVLLSLVGVKVVLVHGGGPEISDRGPRRR